MGCYKITDNTALIGQKPIVYCTSKPIENFKLFYKSNRLHFLSVYRFTLEKLVSHSPSARDLQTFLVFSQHPAWVITPVNR